MLTTADNARVVIGDSDRDRVWVVDVEPPTIRGSVALEPGDEPGRVVESDPATVHVALRGAGAIATIDVVRRRVVSRRAVCPEPRGIAVDRRANALRVACASGELATLSLADTAAPATVQFVHEDLRDVIVRETGLVVSTFRKANLLFLDDQLRLRGVVNLSSGERVPNTAWRTIALRSGAIAVLHQRSLDRILLPTASGYGHVAAPATIVAGLAVVTDLDRPVQMLEFPAVLPVDLVEYEPDTLAVVAAGGTPDSIGEQFRPRPAATQFVIRIDPNSRELSLASRSHLAMAVAGTGVGGRVWYFAPEPAAVWFSMGLSMPIADADSVAHSGYELFHIAHNGGNILACASCHPEGMDDGRAWSFADGPRRSQSLRGTLAGTAPFHWTAEFASLEHLADDVFTSRMGGPMLEPRHRELLRRWLESLRPMRVPAPTDEDRPLVTRGEAVFRSSQAGCAGCHSGPRFTNNETMDIGTGGRFQVPSLLGLRYRAPYMHTGCAATLDDRFASMSCAGDARHRGFGLLEADRRALVAFLRSI